MNAPSPSYAFVLGLVLATATACGEATREPRAVGCGFGGTHDIAEAEGSYFHDVAIARSSDGANVLWSDRSGSFQRRVEFDGQPASAPLRLGPPCPGGLAAVDHGEATFVACLRPSDPDRGRSGRVDLVRVENGRARTVGQTGPVGAESFGVDVVHRGDEVIVGWRDADVFTSRTRVSALRGGAFEPEPRSLSSFGTLASTPALHVVGGAVLYAWVESWLTADGTPAGHLFVQRDQEPPRPSLRVTDLDVRVHLTSDERGPLLALRERRPSGSRYRAFVGRLDERLALAERNLRFPGRADDPRARPMLVPCGEHIFSIATRRSSRRVTMVSLRRLDRDLRPVEDEQQIYEYHARFPQAVGLCVGDRLLIAVGEEQSEVRPRPRLRVYQLRCGPGVRHERTPGTEGNARG